MQEGELRREECATERGGVVICANQASTALAAMTERKLAVVALRWIAILAAYEGAVQTP